MRNVLFVLGGGLLVYWYMCNSKKHKCNCEGDLANDLGNTLNAGLEKLVKNVKDSTADNKPKIVPTGVRESAQFQQDSEDTSFMDRGNCSKPFRNDFGSLYKRYNTKKSVTVSPSRTKVIVVE